MRDYNKLFLSIAFFLITFFNLNNVIANAAPKFGYQAHIANIGWMPFVANDEIAGTVGRSLQMEAIRIILTDEDKSVISYNAHLANIGWQGWKNSGEIAGTTGQSRQMEALQIRLIGNFADEYDIYYRAHVANLGWLPWVKNGETAGTVGKSLRMEAIQIKLAAKNTDNKPMPPSV